MATNKLFKNTSSLFRKSLVSQMDHVSISHPISLLFQKCSPPEMNNSPYYYSKPSKILHKLRNIYEICTLPFKKS